MSPVSSVDTTSTAVVLWLAYCSNKIRTAAECVQKTQETLAAAQSGETGVVAEWLGRQVSIAAMNRGNDANFVAALFALENKELAIGCLDAALGLHSRGTVNIDVQPYLDGYASRYSESTEFLVLKLRYMTLYPNYAENVTEVERIMTVLSTPVEVKEVA